MTAFTVTVRNGPRVERVKHETLEQAVASLREHCEAILDEGRLPGVGMFRDYEPGQRVKARIEISTGKVFRRREAGVDVMGDGSVVPFSGGTFRRPIEGERDSDYADVVAAALRESGRMSEHLTRGHASTDLEGVEVGRRVRLPNGAEAPITVYINGIEQSEGPDYTVDDQGVLFNESIIKEGKLSGLALAVDGDRAVRHLPQERDRRHFLFARRQGPPRDRHAGQ